MNLPKDVVRINGYKGNKRSHIDVKVRTTVNDINWGKGDIIVRIYESDIAKLGFENGLSGVTSYNYYNYVADERLTVKIP